MKANAPALAVIAALAIAGLASTRTAAAVDQSSEITIPGTVVSASHDKLVIRTDDHGHRMSFDVGPAASLPEGLRSGTHVAVTYHPEGPTGQAVDRVLVVDRSASVRSQAAFKVVTGPVDEMRMGVR